MQFLSRPFVVGDRIDILTSGGTKFATGYVERVDPIYTVLRTDTGTPVTINNKVCHSPNFGAQSASLGAEALCLSLRAGHGGSHLHCCRLVL